MKRLTIKLLAAAGSVGVAVGVTREADLPHTEVRVYEETPTLSYEISNATNTASGVYSNSFSSNGWDIANTVSIKYTINK
jgi:hypothetical protein